MRLPNPRGLGAHRAIQRGIPPSHEPIRQPSSLPLAPPLRHGCIATSPAAWIGTDLQVLTIVLRIDRISKYCNNIFNILVFP